MRVRLALPKGRLLAGTEVLLRAAGWDIVDYSAGSRCYHPRCANFPGLALKVFHEKDIPIQVAVGNYDLGICGLDWIQELIVKYPSSALVKLRDLGYGRRNLCVASSQFTGISSLDELRSYDRDIRLAGEYPNLMESFAMGLRLKRFRIFPIWGVAEAYPPENADVVLVSRPLSDGLSEWGLTSLATILCSSAFLIVKRDSWEQKDVSPLLTSLSKVEAVDVPDDGGAESELLPLASRGRRLALDVVRLALPDGHQQQPTIEFLEKAGFEVREYSEGYIRQDVGVADLAVKVVRPQDMPLQVANGNFDLAITGKDWLQEHLYRFPSSPVREILALGFGEVKIAAVVSREMPANNIAELRELLRGGVLPVIRVVSEYVNIADRYAGDRHLSPYRVIPSWGASEAFLPEDADLLIENVQTGQTIVQHNLKIVDTLFESSACLIGNVNSLADPAKVGRIDSVIREFRRLVRIGG